MNRCRLRQRCHRRAVAVTENHYLRALAPLGLANHRAPFFAEANSPYAKHSFQLMRPCWSRSLRIGCHAFSKAPCSCRHLSRRQQVLPDGKCWGISLYRAPLLMSHKMPSKQARLGAGSCPPLGDRDGMERSGASFFHWRSEISSPVWYSRFCIKMILYEKRMIMKCLKTSNAEMGTKCGYETTSNMRRRISVGIGLIRDLLGG